MIEEIAENIYRIEVVMPDNPLRALNSYFIRGDERDLLIDTGFKLPVCRENLAQGLKKLGSDSDRRDILLTHLHSDHSGLADEFVGEKRHIYMSSRDLDYQRRLCEGSFYDGMIHNYINAGYPEELADYHRKHNPAAIGSMKSVDSRFVSMNDGDSLDLGTTRLKMIETPGHTPGNAMFWIEDQKIMFTGDHILFDITPNIVSFYGVKDSLGDYLNSLNKAEEYPVLTALPGHRKSGNYHQRIREIKLHHMKRVEEALYIVTTCPGENAYKITELMKWRIHAKNWENFPHNQRWFAFGECLAHLDYLRFHGKIKREQRNGIWVYEPV